MLELTEVQFKYPGMKSSFEFDLEVAQGQILAIMGKSGSGKSTLLDLIAGFQIPTSGTICWNGSNFQHQPPEQRPVTILFQNHNLFEHLSVAQNLVLGIDPSGRLNRQNQKKVKAALNEVGLAGLDERVAASLSGGQQQRVALARALLRHQPVLLLDEPCTGLDEATRSEILQLIKNIARNKNKAILVATHEPDDVAALGADLYQLDVVI